MVRWSDWRATAFYGEIFNPPIWPQETIPSRDDSVYYVYISLFTLLWCLYLPVTHFFHTLTTLSLSVSLPTHSHDCSGQAGRTALPVPHRRSGWDLCIWGSLWGPVLGPPGHDQLHLQSSTTPTGLPASVKLCLVCSHGPAGIPWTGM